MEFFQPEASPVAFHLGLLELVDRDRKVNGYMSNFKIRQLRVFNPRFLMQWVYILQNDMRETEK